MVEFMEPERLRRPATPGHQDLRAWRFRDRWWNDDTSTVLAWATERGCVFHEAHCAHTPKFDAPTAKCRMDQVRAVFDLEHENGTFRYFGFCGHCLTARIAHYGWVPAEHDLAQLETMRRLLNDLRVLGESPVTKAELAKRMGRYDSGAISPRALERLLDYYRHARGDEEGDLAAFVVE